MYNILITDDEQIAIDSLKFIISKNFEGQINLFTAQSGTDALQIINQQDIDIIFMDINMPGLTGLDTVGCINKIKPDSVIIIISAFDRFQYAQEAMNLGVFKYITKPVNRNVIIQTVRESMTLIDNRRGQISDDLALHKKLDMVSPMVENDFLYSLIFSNDSNADLSSYIEYFNITNPTWCICSLEIPRVASSNQSATYMRIRDVLNEKYRFLVSTFIINRITVFFPIPDELYSTDIFRDELKKIYVLLCNKIGSGIRMGVSNIESDTKLIVKTYNDSVETLNKVPGDGGILFSGEEVHKNLIEKDDSTVKKLYVRLKIGDSSGVISLFEQYFNYLTTFNDSLSKIKTVLIEFLINVKNTTLEINSSYENQNFDDLFSVFANENDLSMLKSFVKQRLMECVNSIGNTRQQKENPTIEKVCKYIDENIEKDLSLEALAAVANVSTFYLSKIFKEEKSETVINFVTNKRLEKSRQLLEETNYSIKEITAFVGYNDQNYFSRLFKNKFGVSPSEFRNN